MTDESYNAGRKAGRTDALDAVYGVRVFSNDTADDVKARIVRVLERLRGTP